MHGLRPSWLRFAAGYLLCGAVSCGEQPLDLIWADQTGQAGSGSGGTTSTGGEQGLAGSDSQPSGGAGGGGGGEPGGGVCALGGEDYYQLRQAESELCAGSGAAATLGPEPIHRVTLSTCDDSPEQIWRVQPLGDGYELRHPSTGSNLDVLMAATSDGTVAILYEPLQFHNQRFFLRLGPEAGSETDIGPGARWMAPLHVDSKCLTYVRTAAPGFEVQIWPCMPEGPRQTWELVPITCGPPVE